MQSELEKALAKLCKHSPPPTVYFCGRTDAGVHATCATCHVDLVRTNASGAPLPPLDNSAILNALNNSLPTSRLGVLACRRVPHTFDAKRAACERTYVYKIHCAAAKPPATTASSSSVLLPNGVATRSECCGSLLRRGWLSAHDKHRALCLAETLDVDKMRAAAKELVGTHDFTSVRSPRCTAGSPTRDLYELSVVEEEGEALSECSIECGRVLSIRARSKAFLRQQVRRIVAVLVEAGRGRMSPEDVRALLDAKDPSQCPVAAAAHGLYLAAVRYPAKVFEEGAGGAVWVGDGDEEEDGEGGEEDEDEVVVEEAMKAASSAKPLSSYVASLDASKSAFAQSLEDVSAQCLAARIARRTAK